MNKVKVAVIGMGDWGRCHLEAYTGLPQVEVVAICDLNEERLQSFVKKYNIQHTYTNAEAMLEQLDIDLVSVVTFEKNHLKPALKALNTGKHVLVEKPVSTRIPEAYEMMAAAKAGQFIIPGHLLRFDPRYAEIHQSLSDGKIGNPISMYLKRSRQKSLFTTYQRTHTVYELMVHDLDLAIWYAGSRVKSVKAYGKSVSDAHVPEVLWACLEFENNTMAVLQSNWMTSDEAGIEIADYIEIIGSKGTAHFDTSHSGVQFWTDEGRYNPDYHIHHEINGRSYGALSDQLRYVCDCILQGEAPNYTSFEDAVHGIEVAEAIINSTQIGEQITLNNSR